MQIFANYLKPFYGEFPEGGKVEKKMFNDFLLEVHFNA